MTQKEFLTALLGKTLNFPADKVASLFTNDDGLEFKPDALQTILDLDAARVTTFKTENQTMFDKGHQKGTGEALSKREKEMKDKYGVSSDKEGLELIDVIVTKLKGADSTLEEDKVKVHPAYVAKVDELENKIKEANTTWETKYNERELGIKKENTFLAITKKADEILSTLKPILPKDVAKAAKQKEFLIRELQAYEYDMQDNDFIVKKDGKLHEDAHGSRIKFDSLVKDLAGGLWEFEQGDNRQGTGNQNNNGGGAGSGANIKVPKNADEYTKFIAEAKTPEERIAIQDGWKAEQAKNNG
jgi:hypothetical protein